MNYLLLLLLALGLSMDAFAVSVAAGGRIQRSHTVHALRIGGSFGFFQMVMPIFGWLMGGQLKTVVASYDHWIAFGLLGIIGGKMIVESFSNEDCDRDRPMTRRRLLMLSLATSIDAFAVGLSLAFLDYPVFVSAAVIGLVTFIVCVAGVFVGAAFCCIWGKRAELAGGIILILLGVNILASHLGM